MGIFSKKPKYALSDILKGLQQAVSSATSMLQVQQMDNLPEDSDVPLAERVARANKHYAESVRRSRIHEYPDFQIRQERKNNK